MKSWFILVMTLLNFVRQRIIPRHKARKYEMHEREGERDVQL